MQTDEVVSSSAEAVAKAPAEAAAPTGVMDLLTESLYDMFTKLMEFLPRFLIFFVILVIGLLIGAFLKKVFAVALGKIGLDKACEKIGLTEMLSGFGVKSSLAVGASKLIYWAVVLFFLMAGAEVLGVTALTDFLKSFATFLPKLITAGAFAMVGLLVAHIVRGALENSAKAMGLEYAGALSRIVYGFLFLLVITLAIGQLDIEVTLLSRTIQIGLMAMGIALSLALGLGLQGMAKNIVSGVYARDLYSPGSTINYDGVDATVVSVGPVTTKLDAGGGNFIMLPNSTLVNEVIRGRGA